MSCRTPEDAYLSTGNHMTVDEPEQEYEQCEVCGDVYPIESLIDWICPGCRKNKKSIQKIQLCNYAKQNGNR